MRITQGHLLLPAVARGAPFTIEVDGEPVTAYAGETIAAALLAAGRQTLSHAGPAGAARGLYCGIGVCFGCLVTVDGVAGVRACVTEARPGMRVETRLAESRP